MRTTTQINLRLPKVWKNKLDLISKELGEQFKEPKFNTQDLIRLTLAEKFNLK